MEGQDDDNDEVNYYNESFIIMNLRSATYLKQLCPISGLNIFLCDNNLLLIIYWFRVAIIFVFIEKHMKQIKTALLLLNYYIYYYY